MAGSIRSGSAKQDRHRYKAQWQRSRPMSSRPADRRGRGLVGKEIYFAHIVGKTHQVQVITGWQKGSGRKCLAASARVPGPPCTLLAGRRWRGQSPAEARTGRSNTAIFSVVIFREQKLVAGQAGDRLSLLSSVTLTKTFTSPTLTLMVVAPWLWPSPAGAACLGHGRMDCRERARSRRRRGTAFHWPTVPSPLGHLRRGWTGTVRHRPRPLHLRSCSFFQMVRFLERIDEPAAGFERLRAARGSYAQSERMVSDIEAGRGDGPWQPVERHERRRASSARPRI